MAGLVEIPPIFRSVKAPRRFEEQIHYACDHLYLTAFIVCSGHGIIGTFQNCNRVSFVFAKTPSLLTDVARFMAGASIPARRFSFELLKLKKMLHAVESSTLDKFVTDEKDETSKFNS